MVKPKQYKPPNRWLNENNINYQIDGAKRKQYKEPNRWLNRNVVILKRDRVFIITNVESAHQIIDSKIAPAPCNPH